MQFESHNVGDKSHNELWIPSNELHLFNENIVGKIKIINAFFGSQYKPSNNVDLNTKLNEFKP